MLEATKMALEKMMIYIGDSWQYVLLILAILYLLISKEEKEHKWLLAGYTILFGVVYVFPITAKIIARFIGDSVYWRMLWALPIPLVIAYVCTRVWRRQKSRLRQFACLAVFAVLIGLSGNFVYGPDTPYVKAGNHYKVPPEVCWVCDVIRENIPESGQVGVVAPEELVGYIRQYDAGIKLAYGRRGANGRRRKWIKTQMAAEDPNFTGLIKRARKIQCNFLVYPADEAQNEQIVSLGYEAVGQVNTYIIYRDSTM